MIIERKTSDDDEASNSQTIDWSENDTRSIQKTNIYISLCIPYVQAFVQNFELMKETMTSNSWLKIWIDSWTILESRRKKETRLQEKHSCLAERLWRSIEKNDWFKNVIDECMKTTSTNTVQEWIQCKKNWILCYKMYIYITLFTRDDYDVARISRFKTKRANQQERESPDESESERNHRILYSIR